MLASRFIYDTCDGPGQAFAWVAVTQPPFAGCVTAKASFLPRETSSEQETLTGLGQDAAPAGAIRK